MKKVSLDTWIQLLGMIGLLGGLVFVGLELQQNQTIALASQVQARTNNISDVFIAPMDGQIDALAHWYIPWEDQTETQKLFSMQFKRWQSNVYENNFTNTGLDCCRKSTGNCRNIESNKHGTNVNIEIIIKIDFNHLWIIWRAFRAVVRSFL